MSSGQLSIAFPVRKGIPPATVKHEIRKQMKSFSQARGQSYSEVGAEVLPCELALMSLRQSQLSSCAASCASLCIMCL